MNDPAQFLALLLIADGLLILAWWLIFDREPKAEPPSPEPTASRRILVFQMSDGHTYMVRYREGQEREVARQLGRWGADDDVPLSIEEAVEVSQDFADATVVPSPQPRIPTP